MGRGMISINNKFVEKNYIHIASAIKLNKETYPTLFTIKDSGKTPLYIFARSCEKTTQLKGGSPKQGLN
jgi:hypothetical protein